MCTWYKPKSTSSGLKHDANLFYSYEQQQTVLATIAVAGFMIVTLLLALVVSGIALAEASSHQHAKAAPADAAASSSTGTAQPPPPKPNPKPNLFVWLRDVEGLDPCASSPPSPAFQLVVDADGIPPRYRYCSGGGNSMLRVSHRGIILAWGHVPAFCVEADSQSGEEHGFADGVVTVKATADGAVLREEVRRSIQNDLGGEGKAHFSVEGEVAGLGYLRCETSLFQRNDTEESYPCLVQ